MQNSRSLNRPLIKGLPYCYLFLQELNFTKIEQAYFAGLKFCDLAKNNTLKGSKFTKIVKNNADLSKQTISLRISTTDNFF